MKPRIVLSIEDLPTLTDEQLAAVRGGGGGDIPKIVIRVELELPVDNGIGTSPSGAGGGAFDGPTN